MVAILNKYYKIAVLASYALPGKAFAAIIADPDGDPVSSAQGITNLIARAQNLIWAAAGAIAVAMIIYGAVTLFMAGGNEEKMGKAKKIITYAIMGIAIIILSEILINFFVLALGGEVK